jgi:pyruvate dehydrogenase E2 component (dihydrolipoamide acetyltransferase)
MATIELKVPDIGDFKEVEVIELLVKPGETVGVEQSLVTVESDKASMEIPASVAGRIVELKVRLGDKVSEGTVVAIVEPTTADAAAGAGATSAGAVAPARPPAAAPSPAAAAPAPEAPVAAGSADADGARDPMVPPAPSSAGPTRAPPVAPAPGDAAGHVVKPHASPSVRKFARELGVDLAQVRGSGPRQRITHDDVRGYVKGLVARAAEPAAPAGAAAPGAGAALGLLPWPQVDFAKFGPIERKQLPRIRKLSAANLHRNWVMIPHVTNHEDADVTALEAFRVQVNQENEKAGRQKLTMLAFLIKACVHALKSHPEFNASFDGDALVMKQYWHVGFAADTPNGLMVPVIRDADRKGVSDLAKETAELAKKARDGKLSPSEMQGGTFSISSLGGIGGTSFTPIINAPEVAILGVSRTATKPVWTGTAFEPRLILPLSLSYDHRVIDGAAAARFNAHLAALMADYRRVLL